MSASNANINVIAKPFNLPSNTSHHAIFQTLASLPWSTWLDSCDSNHQDSQFDIIVWQPAITIESTEKSTKVTAVNPELEHLSGHFTEDPLALLERIQQQVFKSVTTPNCHLPYVGGSLGYFSYDLGRCFEKLPTLAQDDINLPVMSVGIYLNALVYDNSTQTCWLVAPEDKWQSLSEELVSQSTPNAGAFKLSSAWQANMSKADYVHKFDKVQQYLLAGDCYQINLAQRFSAEYEGDEYAAYLALRDANQAPFSAFMRFNDHAILSISPERFLKVDNKQVQTKPIKGTLPRSADKTIDQANAEKLKLSSKDRAENLMIVDLLRNDLSRTCIAGSVKVPKLFDIESFPAVHHLVSTVVGELADKHSCTDLLRAAFPGGSITGAPKIRAMEIIEELEPHRRNLYCGSIGYISACGNMDTSITIRTLICKNNQIHCWAGGGLVADSKVDSEYQETFDKVGKILPVLES